MLLIYQWWYYGKYYENGVYKGALQRGSPSTEASPLLSDSAARGPENAATRTYDALVNLTDQLTGHHITVFRYAITLLFIAVTGVLAYYSADSSAAAVLRHGSRDDAPVDIRWDGQLLGWLSAFLYLSSRIPQIIKNRDTKCAGLSLALFVFAVGGNVTYVLVRIHSRAALTRSRS